MKICEKCNANFPSWIRINGKKINLGGRRYCLTCVPHGSCPYCGRTDLVGQHLGGHIIGCSSNPQAKETHEKAASKTRGRKLSKKARKRISIARKKYLATPEGKANHNWSRYHNQESKPEANFRTALVDLGISALQYYRPPTGKKNYEIDFMLEDKRIGFEINGQQHYGSDGKLAPYYKKRHNYLCKLGYTIHEIHYSECLYIEQIKELITKLLMGVDVEYQSKPEVVNYRPLQKAAKKKKREEESEKLKIKMMAEAETEEERTIIENAFDNATDGIVKWNNRKGISHPYSRKVKRPSKEKLHKLVWEKPTSVIAKQFGVSDNAVGKWCKWYGIDKPGRGYWAKQEALNNSKKPNNK